ncbi:MAG: hypothetical protein KW802_04215 [Candidatus Doudnabacteria bacterium]|nr:hypothetical protein [Candidatus Doudnabacteria bacterium]
MNKKIIFIVVIILAVLGSGIYFLLGPKTTPSNQSQKPLQLKKVIDEAVISPIGALDNNALWYFNVDGRLFKANPDGSNISEFPLPSLPKGMLKTVLWPKNGSDFIAIASEGPVLNKYFYESSSKLFINFPQNVQWLEWLPDGKRVIYVWQGSDKKSQQLVMANADGTGYKTIAPLLWPDLALKASPDGKTALMYRTNATGDTNQIYSVNLDTGVIMSMVDTGKNTGVVWLPTGNKFLYSQTSKVYLFDVLNRQSLDLGLNTSLEKIAVDQAVKYLYAAVPKQDKSGDYLLRINLDSNKLEKYYEPNSEVRAKNLFLIGSTIYFTDIKDNKLYNLDK